VKATNAIDLLAKYSRICVLVLLTLALSLFVPNFMTFSNVITVLQQSSLMLIMSLGMTCAMLLGRGVDMSIGSTLALANCLAAPFMLARYGTGSLLLGVLISLAVGVGIGLINGVLVAYLHLPSVLATFATREIFRGIVYLLLKGKVISGMHPTIMFIGSGRLFGEIPVTIIIALILTLIVGFLLKGTSVGRQLYIVGANPEAARFSGIRSKRVIISGFVLSGLFASIAGLVYLGRLGTAEAEIGAKFAFNCISAVAIGGISFNGGIGKVSGAVIGCLILNMITNSLNLLKVDSLWQGTASGVVILLAVILDHVARKRLGQ